MANDFLLQLIDSFTGTKVGDLERYTVLAITLILIFIKRFYEQQAQQELGDETSQFFIAIRAILQKSVSPLITSRNKYRGRCYYPMALVVMVKLSKIMPHED